MAGVTTPIVAEVGPPAPMPPEVAALRVARLREVLEQFPGKIARLERTRQAGEVKAMKAKQADLEARIVELEAMANPTPESRRAALEQQKAAIERALKSLDK
jgi:hypothetical protein